LKRSETEVCVWCLSYLAMLLDIPADRIDPDAKFARLGMDSALTVSFVLALETWLKTELDPEIVFEYPTISQLAKYLSARGSNQMPK
jgi:acyl carrier protein